MTSRADKAVNLERAERLVARAAATGADVVALPEKWNAIGSVEELHAAAEPLEGGESVAAMAGWARTHGITLVGGSTLLPGFPELVRSETGLPVSRDPEPLTAVARGAGAALAELDALRRSERSRRSSRRRR